MKEDFNRVVVLDFSKITEKDVDKVKAILNQVNPSMFGSDFDADRLFNMHFPSKKKEITLDDVLGALDEHGMSDVVDNLIDSYPGAAISVVLRTIALMMDENYPNHISDYETIYYYSFLDGKIHSISTQGINKKAFKYFAAFRTQKDAVKAIRLMQAAIKYLSE